MNIALLVITALGFLAFWATVGLYGQMAATVISHAIFFVTLPLVTYPHLTRSYALGVWHASPVRHAYLLLGGPDEDRQSALVKLTRAAESTNVYVAQCDAGPQMQELARQLARDRKQTLASDIELTTPQERQRN